MDFKQFSFELRESEKRESLLKFTIAALNAVDGLNQEFEVEKFEVGNRGSHYYGLVTLSISGGRFSFADTEDDPELLILKLTRQIQRQVKKHRVFRHVMPYNVEL